MFKNKPKNVAEYISRAPKEAQKKLREMRKIIKSAAPGSTEGLKWSMPSYSYKRIVVTFASFKQHIGFFPGPSAITKFKKDLTKYKTSRGTIQFPYEKPIPHTLVKKITQFRVKENKEKDARWRS